MSDGLYLTVANEKRRPENDGYIAVITSGRYGKDEEVTVCSVEVVPNMKAAKRWFRRMCQERPWETRQ